MEKVYFKKNRPRIVDLIWEKFMNRDLIRVMIKISFLARKIIQIGPHIELKKGFRLNLIEEITLVNLNRIIQ